MPDDPMSDQYLAGFVDGEGCFVLNYRRDLKKHRPCSPAYYFWRFEFAIVLSEADKPLLELIRSKLGCGRVFQ